MGQSLFWYGGGPSPTEMALRSSFIHRKCMTQAPKINRSLTIYALFNAHKYNFNGQEIGQKDLSSFGRSDILWTLFPNP